VRGGGLPSTLTHIPFRVSSGQGSSKKNVLVNRWFKAKPCLQKLGTRTLILQGIAFDGALPDRNPRLGAS